MAFGKKRQSGIARLFVKILSWAILVGVTLLGVTLGVTLRYSLSTFQSKIENTLMSTASSLANSAMVRDALDAGSCSEALIGYLDDLVAQTRDLDIITIAGTDSIRLYHVVHSRIGQHFVGGDQGRALAGESYFSDAVGTLGLQRRYFSPVLDEGGAVTGFVMASTTMDSLQNLRGDITRTYGRMAAWLMAASLLLSGLLALFLHRLLHGFGPEELVRTYITQNEVLNNLTEGVISVDASGRIQLMNRAAEEMLGQRSELLEGAALDSVIRDNSGESLLSAETRSSPTSRPNILSQCIPLEKDGHRRGATLILTDRSEAMRTAEQLTGTRHIISTLRANSHEFMNRLQVISGLLQMGRSADALDYIGRVSAVHAKAITPILQHISNPNVAALLLGKLDNMKELDIQLTLLANSHLPEHSQYLSTSDLVTTIGNLLENAIEAVNAQCGSGPRSIVLQITEDETGLLLMVSDTGTGIPPRLLEHIYDQGFSTKTTEGRGMGMYLVRDIVLRRGGNIEVDSEPGSGTTFTLIFSEKRQRK